jgi:LysM repeat protein
MKKLSSILFFGLILFSFSLNAQNKNYPIKIVNGVEYLVYSVETSEGLFAIARKFNVTKSDLEKANPQIKSGIKPGQQLLIPAPLSPSKPIVQKSSVTVPTVEFIQHKVENKQTLFAICRKYNVSQEQLKKYNPAITSGLIEGAILKIPVPTKLKEQIETSPKTRTPELTTNKPVSVPAQNKFLIHKVLAGETLFSISKKYAITVEELIKQNPTSASKLSVGTELKIATSTHLPTVSIPEKESVNSAPASSFEIKSLLDKASLSKWKSKKSIKIGFLLPFMLDKSKNESNADRFVEFYSGALLAIDGWKKKGISFEIYTYDTDNSEDKMTEVLQNSELKTMDLLIGPAFSNQVSLVADFAKENQINTLIPFTSKVNEIDSNPFLFQFNPGIDVEIPFTADRLYKTNDATIIFAEIEGVTGSDEGNIKFEALKTALRKSKKTFVSKILTTPVGSDFTSELSKNSKNIVIFNSDKYSLVSPYLSALRSQINSYDIVLLGQYSWRNQNIQLPTVNYVAPFISSINNATLTDFNELYVRSFDKDVTINISPRYDLLGYDLSNYFITLINRYGTKFGDKVGSFNFINGVQSQPHFERTSTNSGFVNQKLYLGEDTTLPIQAN